jgi:hypothetical protein
MDEVHYTLARNDFWHLQRYAFWRQLRRTIRLRLIFSSVILVGLFVFLDQQSAGNYGLSILGVVVAMFLILIILLLFYGLWFLLMRRAASGARGVLGKIGVNVLTISEQGVQRRNELSNGTSSWRAYKAIEEDKHNIYFVVDEPGHIFIAQLIPKCAFESPSQAERFIARARGYWQEQARYAATSHA